MKKKSAIIFDCDGVMFDSRQANINFYNHLLNHFGLPPIPEEQVPFVHTNTAEASVRHIFQGTAFVDQAQAYRMAMDYTPFIKDMILEEGLIELLSALKVRYGLAVATNRSNTIGRVLEFHNLDTYFDIVVSSLDVTHPKPHPESLFKILDFFGIESHSAYYVGDSSIDADTAKAASVPFIAFKNMELDAANHVENHTEIAEFLELESVGF